ncbi:MAG: S8 family serine peptidase [Leptospiraceae bacterium]|nr:S8 family serine peptidase [Leptospiraceae bacterium]
MLVATILWSMTLACQSKGGDDDVMNLLLLWFLVNNTNNTASCSTVSDPLFSNQWHLSNTGQLGGTSGEDANVTAVWSSGICGSNISFAVVDDGLAIAHEDLSPNVAAGKSYNYLNGGTDPSASSANHGTSVGGVLAARSNSIGVRGASPLGSLRGYNLLQNSTSSNEADAMTRDVANVHISNNSWGPTDLSGKLSDSSSIWRSAIDTGLSTGRSGLGTLYFWAAGNGDTSGSYAGIDNANFDGYANYHGVMAVCAIGDDGKKASYSEQGANLLVCAHSQGSSGKAITTTDNIGSLGYNTNGGSGNLSDTNYTNTFNGTSAATPLAAGVTGLVLQANPNLGYRDVRLILAQSARKNDASDSDWATNGAGMHINHKYGFGAVDANAAVTLAKTWTNIAAQKTYTTSTSSPSATITDGSAVGVTSNIIVSGSGVSKIEFVAVNVTFSHNYYRDLEMILTAPSGTKSTILARGTSSGSPDGICVNLNTFSIEPNGNCSVNTTWRFGTTRHMQESADGTWSLQVRDQGVRGTANGTFTSWNMKFYGY